MGKPTVIKSEVEDIDEFLNGFDIQDDDYILVVGADGQLKNVFMPESEVFEPHENVQKIFSMFGITDVDYMSETRTIH